MSRELDASPDLATLPALLAERATSLGAHLHYFVETDSTNDRAKEDARAGAPHGSLYLAESQTKGRGRQGRVWQSPRGENLLFTVILRFGHPIARLQVLPLVVGLSVRDAVARVATRATVGVKWPNDVWIEGRKVAGILVESVGAPKDPALIVGIGLNVFTRDFPDDLRATSVALFSERPPQRAELLADLLAGLDRDLYLAAGRGLGPFTARLKAADLLQGQQVRSDTGATGIAEGIDIEGRLLVRQADGQVVRWGAGEVHLSRG